MSRDPQDSQPNDPESLHKYLYANGIPINGIDPTGRDTTNKPAGGLRGVGDTIAEYICVINMISNTIGLLDYKVKVAVGVGAFILVKWISVPFFDSERLMNYIDPDDEPEGDSH